MARFSSRLFGAILLSFSMYYEFGTLTILGMKFWLH